MVESKGENGFGHFGKHNDKKINFKFKNKTKTSTPSLFIHAESYEQEND